MLFLPEDDTYADDTSTYVIDNDLTTIETKLNVDADNVYKWCVANNLKVNVQKTKCMLITTSRRRALMPCTDLNVNIKGEKVPMIKCEKLLGVHISDTIDWSDHVVYLCTCLHYRLYVLNQIRKYLSVKARCIYMLTVMFCLT